ncbi:MAG: UDP-N-acetylmuramoyl-L-alanine--D-glutamate ligase [Patescibacteria group bacterium]|nr:UDP-N-acetylmuramoyl-L-alanine--D-glutamate ligase [Patescibacteria group bacterium]
MTNHLKDKKVLVMGLGLVGGGLGVIKWLSHQGAKITVTDLRDRKTLLPTLKKLAGLKIKCILGQHRASDFRQADLIIKNPAVPIESPYLKIARQAHVPVTSDIELFGQRFNGRTIALTGTKGKSTTVHLIKHILETAKQSVELGGNIGATPLLSLNKNNVFILELSSFQLENLKISPDISIITNIFPDHLNRHKTMAKYVAIKANIFKGQCRNQFTVLNYDNLICRRLGNEVPASLVFFSAKTNLRPKNCQIFFSLKNNSIIVDDKKSIRRLISLSKTKLPGQHNLENILAAVATAFLTSIKPTIIQRAINSFSGVANRLELIRTVNGVKYYNDTTATNPGATVAALAALGKNKNIILIAGGADKNLSFDELAPKIKKTCQRIIMLSGTATPKFIQTLKKNKYPVKDIIEFDNFNQAIKAAKEIAKPGQIVLLSPACASFGMFKNEFDRGKQFIKLVKNL